MAISLFACHIAMGVAKQGHLTVASDKQTFQLRSPEHTRFENHYARGSLMWLSTQQDNGMDPWQWHFQPSQHAPLKTVWVLTKPDVRVAVLLEMPYQQVLSQNWVSLMHTKVVMLRLRQRINGALSWHHILHLNGIKSFSLNIDVRHSKADWHLTEVGKNEVTGQAGLANLPLATLQDLFVQPVGQLLEKTTIIQSHSQGTLQALLPSLAKQLNLKPNIAWTVKVQAGLNKYPNQGKVDLRLHHRQFGDIKLVYQLGFENALSIVKGCRGNKVCDWLPDLKAEYLQLDFPLHSAIQQALQSDLFQGGSDPAHKRQALALLAQQKKTTAVSGLHQDYWAALQQILTNSDMTHMLWGWQAQKSWTPQHFVTTIMLTALAHCVSNQSLLQINTCFNAMQALSKQGIYMTITPGV